MRNLNYLLLTVLLLSACGGDKNESTANGNAVFAVRTFEDGGTEVALLNGNFSTEDGALAAAENARWVEVDEFPVGNDIDFIESNNNEFDFSSVRIQYRYRSGGKSRCRRKNGERRRHCSDRERTKVSIRLGNNHHDRWRPHRSHRNDGWDDWGYKSWDNDDWNNDGWYNNYPDFIDCGRDGFFFGEGCFEPYSRKNNYRLRVDYSFQMVVRKSSRRSYNYDRRCMVRVYR